MQIVQRKATSCDAQLEQVRSNNDVITPHSRFAFKMHIFGTATNTYKILLNLISHWGTHTANRQKSKKPGYSETLIWMRENQPHFQHTSTARHILYNASTATFILSNASISIFALYNASTSILARYNTSTSILALHNASTARAAIQCPHVCGTLQYEILEQLYITMQVFTSQYKSS